MCQWEGCKHYGVPSSSFRWLQKHVQQKHTKGVLCGVYVSFACVTVRERVSLYEGVHLFLPEYFSEDVCVSVCLSVSLEARHACSKHVMLA